MCSLTFPVSSKWVVAVSEVSEKQARLDICICCELDLHCWETGELQNGCFYNGLYPTILKFIIKNLNGR